MKRSLRMKAFLMNIFPVAMAAVLFMVMGIYQFRHFAGIMEKTNLDQNDVIMDTASEALRDLVTEDYQKFVVAEAKLLNGEFFTMRHDLEVLASQVQRVLESSKAATARVSPPSLSDTGKLKLQLLYSDEADPYNEYLSSQIRRVGGLSSMMMEIVDGTDALVNCVVSLAGGASIIADYSPENKVRSDGTPVTFNAERRPWYVGAFIHDSTYFTPVNTDVFTGGREVMVGVPFYVDNYLAGVCGGSLRIEDMGAIVADAQLGEYTDTCLINENGNIIYSSRSSGELGQDENSLKSLKESSNAELAALVGTALDGDVGFSLVHVDGEMTYVAYAPIETVGWTMLITISQEDLNRTAVLLTQKSDSVMAQSINEVRLNEKQSVLGTLVIAVAVLFLAVLIAMLFANGLSRPIKRMTFLVSEMKGDDMVFRMENSLKTGDEIQTLAEAFEAMSVKMKGYVQKIVQITSEKQRLDTELSVAADIQHNMLPAHFPAFPGRKEFDLYAVMDPAKEVGGDFYDFFLIDDDHLAVVCADVSGKGVPAALFMVISKVLIKNVALSGFDQGPAGILRKVNNLLCEGNEDDMFVTAWLGILTISTGRLVSACAGHEYPVFYRKDEGFVLEKDPHGMAMGGLEGVKYKDSDWTMNPGDMLFLYTDGVPEANNSEEELFGCDRMLAALEKSREMTGEDPQSGNMDLKEFLRTVREQIDEFVGDTPQFDDLTMLCLDYRSPGK